MANNRLFLLQSRPVTTLYEENPVTGEYNCTLSGDFLWSNTNFCEAVPDVMTPSSWSLVKIFHYDTSPFQFPRNIPTAGLIGGRPYMNLSFQISFYKAFSRDYKKVLNQDLVGSIPEDIEIPVVPLSRLFILSKLIPGMFNAKKAVGQVKKNRETFITGAPIWYRNMLQTIQGIQDKKELINLWVEKIRPYYMQACWMVRASAKGFVYIAAKLRQDLTRLVGEADANTLLSNLRGNSEILASLGPLVGLEKVVRGKMEIQEYLELYGHRGPHEFELYIPGRLKYMVNEYKRSGVDASALLKKQKEEFDTAWEKFKARYPKKVKFTGRSLNKVSDLAHKREAARSEMIRITPGLSANFSCSAAGFPALEMTSFSLPLMRL